MLGVGVFFSSLVDSFLGSIGSGLLFSLRNYERYPYRNNYFEE
jgi:hypothetical protein